MALYSVDLLGKKHILKRCGKIGEWKITTKMIGGMEKMPYSEKLKEFNLFLLSTRDSEVT